MKTFLAALQMQSRFSRATSKRLTVPHLAAWSLLKGISVTATGDFTHPQWREELKEALVRDEASELYRLRQPPDFALEAPGFAPPPSDADARGPLFLLEAEISSIYKKDGAVRKVHNLVYMPDFDSADRLCRKLEQIGNLASDGRPILGLDSRRLLEMVLETDERGVLIPAHIWTPWFSLFGSRSGFDSLEACFGDLSSHIFAMETGLSSDPDMNRLWSGLDRIVMVSNSDAHSGENLGREATIFSGAPSYDGLFGALRRAATGEMSSGECAYGGTLEFFPEEGKYHLDGHRACHVVLDPEETRRLHNRCPVCGKELTVGVLHRVTALADRKTPQPPAGTGFSSIIPLPEIIGEILGVGSKSVRTQARLADVVRKLGPELDILTRVPEADVRREWEELGEAICRMRQGRVFRQAGFDGEYGVVRVFDPRENVGKGGRRQGTLSSMVRTRGNALGIRAGGAVASGSPDGASAHPAFRNGAGDTAPSMPADSGQDTALRWSAAQQKAICSGPSPVLVLAGPGAGKTRTLVGRMERLLHEGLDASALVAVTFTRKAAGELRERLSERLSGKAVLPCADTLHALALHYWPDREPVILSEEAARNAFTQANAEKISKGKNALRDAFDTLSLCRETLLPPPEGLAEALARYTAWKRERGLADYTDLLENWLRRLKAGEVAPVWQHVLVDEVQDLSSLQIELVCALLPPSGEGFFGIGDPDQAIYGFRGAHPDVLGALQGRWPDLETVTLAESYRSGQDILTSADALLGTASRSGRLHAARNRASRLKLFAAPDARREAFWIAEEIARLLGATSHTLADARRVADPLAGTCSPGDIAVLVRTKALMEPLREALFARGVPVAVPEAEPFWEESRVACILTLAATHFGKPAAPCEALPPLPSEVWTGGPKKVLEALVAHQPYDPHI